MITQKNKGTETAPIWGTILENCSLLQKGSCLVKYDDVLWGVLVFDRHSG